MLFGKLADGGRVTVDVEHKKDDKGVESDEIKLDIQPLPKKDRSRSKEAAEHEEEAAAD